MVVSDLGTTSKPDSGLFPTPGLPAGLKGKGEHPFAIFPAHKFQDLHLLSSLYS